MKYGKVEEPSSLRSRCPSTARYAATSVILTVTLSRSDRVPISRTVKARPSWDADLNGYGCSLERSGLPCQASPSTLHDTLIQRIRRRVSADLALNNHSL